MANLQQVTAVNKLILTLLIKMGNFCFFHSVLIIYANVRKLGVAHTFISWHTFLSLDLTKKTFDKKEFQNFFFSLILETLMNVSLGSFFKKRFILVASLFICKKNQNSQK